MQIKKIKDNEEGGQFGEKTYNSRINTKYFKLKEI